MFAIIEAGGKQYKVEKGTTFDIEKLEAKEGSSITFDKVLLISDKSNFRMGSPFIDGAAVTAKVVAQIKAEKLRIFKMKAKDHYQRTTGHRQKLTKLEITEIKEQGATKAPKSESEEKKPAARKPAAKKSKAVAA